jgi:hypothetical protein
LRAVLINDLDLSHNNLSGAHIVSDS